MRHWPGLLGSARHGSARRWMAPPGPHSPIHSFIPWLTRSITFIHSKESGVAWRGETRGAWGHCEWATRCQVNSISLSLNSNRMRQGQCYTGGPALDLERWRETTAGIVTIFREGGRKTEPSLTLLHFDITGLETNLILQNLTRSNMT